MLLQQCLQHLNQPRLHLPRQQLPRAIILPNLLKLLIILKEELQIVIRNIDFKIRTELLLILLRYLPTGEGLFVDFVLDLLSCVSEEDAGVWKRG